MIQNIGGSGNTKFSVEDASATLGQISFDLQALRMRVVQLEDDVSLLTQTRPGKGKITQRATARSKSDNSRFPTSILEKPSPPSDLDGVDCFFVVNDGRTTPLEKKMSNPLSEDSGTVEAVQGWLKVVATVKTEQEKFSRDRNIAMTIVDADVRDYIKAVLGPYIEHFTKSDWDRSEVTLSRHWNAILFNWRKFTASQDESAEASAHVERQKKLDVIMRFIRAYYPGMVKIQDEWSGCAQVLWNDIRVLFQPGSLIVAADWSKQDSGRTPNSVQVLKVHHLAINRLPASTSPSFAFTAWLWDWDGSHLVRTMYEFKIDEYRGQRAITELPFYPIDFFVNDKGEKGEAAIRSCQQYEDRKELFASFTRHQSSPRRILTYTGEVFGLRGDPRPHSDHKSFGSFRSIYSESLSQRLIDVSRLKASHSLANLS